MPISMPLITNLTPVTTAGGVILLANGGQTIIDAVTTLTLVQGDDYNAAVGLQIVFDAAQWPDLSSATTSLIVTSGAPNAVLTCSGTYNLAAHTLTFNALSRQTAHLVPDSTGTVQQFKVVADFISGGSAYQRTLVYGPVLVIGAIAW